jgi:hypothetical protein
MPQPTPAITSLEPLLDVYLASADGQALEAHLVQHSNLPGPRGNLELADALMRMVARHCTAHGEKLWSLCTTWTAISDAQAPTNDPREFLPFCGSWALGALGALLLERLEEALERLHALARDPRWRMREAVAKALQALLLVRRDETLRALESWLQPGDWLAMRAVAAAVAEPAPLQDTTVARAALELHRRIWQEVRENPSRKDEEFKVLRQGLGYTYSVVVSALPEAGFALLEEMAATPDADVFWILRENLKKNRLVKRWGERVAALSARIGEPSRRRP